VANVNHYQAAEQMIGGRMSEIDLGRAQVHATLALIDMLGAVLAELVAVRQVAAQSPPPAD
jgi:hypothetical protein